jgi:hypothetical protein
MTGFREYDVAVRPSFSLSVAFLTALAVVLFLAVSLQAQINGAPPSVTSPGFGGNAINGARSSVTSVGPQGYAPPFRGPLSAGNGDGFHHGHGDGNHGNGNGNGNHGNGDGHRGHRQDPGAVGPVWYAYPVPYAIDSAPPEDQSEDAAENDADYQGGPTVFDRRGSGERSYAPPAKDPAPAHAAQRVQQEEAPAVDPDPPLPPTLLVFKDGRTAEVANYAVVGPTLFDLTPGHRRKIAVMDLDLEATRRQNDERGVTFQLPQSGQAN